MIQSVSFIGSGNVATHLVKSLFYAGIQVNQICSRTLANAQTLATQVKATAISDIKKIETVDLLLICVPDDKIGSILDQLNSYNGLVAHTSGITGLQFSRKNLGYFYPLQSFKKNQSIDLKTTPFFVQAKQNGKENELLALAKKLSNNAQILPQEQKEKLHLAAVFVNNYVNHLFGLTDEFLTENNLDFSLLLPIIETTVNRAKSEKPYNIQTGPAIRNDEKTLAKHEDLLANFTEMKTVYQQLAQSIQQKHNK